MNKYIVRSVSETPESRINQKKDNIFYFDIYNTETKKCVRVTGSSKEDIDEKHKIAEEKIKNKIFTTDNAIINDAWLFLEEEFKGENEQGFMKDSTLRGYRSDWKAIEDITFNEIKLKNYLIKKIDVDFLDDFSEHLTTYFTVRQNKASWNLFGRILNKAAKKKMGIMRNIHLSADREKFNKRKKNEIKETPPILQGANPTEKFLPTVNKMLELSKCKEKNTPGYYVGNYYYVMWRTLLEGSLAISELLPLNIKDYDPINHALDINKTVDIHTGKINLKPKTPDRDGVVFMSPEYTKIYLHWVEELKTWNNPKGLLFPSRVGTIKSYRRVDLQFKNFFKKAGFEERITLHDFRSFGSKIREFMGLDETAQEHLRHATPQMTKYYQRGKNWKDAEKQIAASTQIAGLLK
jgi:integrase